MEISRAQVSELREKAQRAMARARNMAEKSEKVIETALRTAEVGGAAFGMGVVKGRFGNIEVVGVPIDLVAASGLHLLGFFGGDRYADHLHALGDGALASYLTTLGTGVGRGMLEPAAARP